MLKYITHEDHESLKWFIRRIGNEIGHLSLICYSEPIQMAKGDMILELINKKDRNMTIKIDGPPDIIEAVYRKFSLG